MKMNTILSNKMGRHEEWWPCHRDSDVAVTAAVATAGPPRTLFLGEGSRVRLPRTVSSLKTCSSIL